MSATDLVAGYDDTVAAGFDFHHSMLADERRTHAFLRAILKVVEPGDVVIDIGAGTGVLSLFAALAGARAVYAIERDPIAEVARHVVAANGLCSTVKVIRGSSFETDVPAPADVLITETIGKAGFDEGIVTLAADAERRLLSPGARVIPQRVVLHAALVELPRDYAELDRWSRLLATFDFSPLRRVAMNNLHCIEISPVALVTEPIELVPSLIPCGEEALTGRALVTARRDGVVHGIGAWFSSELAPSITITNAPAGGASSWEHGFFPIETPLEMAAGESVEMEICISAGGADWTWRVGSAEMRTTPDASTRTGHATM